MVEIISDEKGPEVISRKEALLRAHGILGIDQQSSDLVDQLIMAANQARHNEFGVGYDSKSLHALRARAADEAKDAK